MQVISRVGGSAVYTVHCGSLTMPRERAGPRRIAVFYRGDRGVCGAPSRDRHLLCAYRIIINKRITLTTSNSKRQSFAGDTAAAKLGSTATSADIVFDSAARPPAVPASLLKRGYQHAFIRLSDFGR